METDSPWQKPRGTVQVRHLWVIGGIGLLLLCASCGDSSRAYIESSPVTTTPRGSAEAPEVANSVAASSPPVTQAFVATPSSILSAVPPPATAPLPAPPAAAALDLGGVQAALAALVVADPDPTRTPYERDEYTGDGWKDLDGDCISTRHELLIAYSSTPPVMDGCRVASGTWTDPYTGDVYTFADQVTVDHLVPLAEAHKSGAWRWDADTKYRFVNDETPGQLALVSDDINQAKAAQTPDQWLPPLHQCQYAVDWIATKSRYQLTITAAEHDTLARLVAGCDGASRTNVAAPAVVVTTTATTSTTLAVVAAVGLPGQVQLLSCDKRGEEVVLANPGGAAISLSGYVLHDEGRKHETGLGQYGSLQPGQRLRILSGDGAVSAADAVVWTRQNVWNNDGDTANLVDPSGAVTTTRC